MYVYFFLFIMLFAHPKLQRDMETKPSLAQTVFTKVNQERTKRGLGMLLWNSKLESGASIHANEMAKNNFFSHYNSANKKYYSPADRLKFVNYSYALMGENNATQSYTRNSIPSEEVMAAKYLELWVNSPIHSKIMFTKDFKDAAISIVSVSRENDMIKFYAVMNFGNAK